MTPRPRYGDAVARSFQIHDSTPRLVTRALTGQQIAISRLSIGARQFGLSPSIPPEDTFILAVYLTPVPEHELFSRGRPFLKQPYPKGGMRIVNLMHEFSARISCVHESMVFHIPRRALDEFTAENDNPPVPALGCTPGLVDPTLNHLVSALEPALQRPWEANQLFIDHAALAVTAHLVGRHSQRTVSRPIMRGGLTPRQMARTEQYMAANFRENIGLEDVASQCGLSRAHFARSFRRTAGITPHQWLLRYRVEQAKAMMLANSGPLEQVALACGFAGQSHFTRVFTQSLGVTPSSWRRENRRRRLHV